MKKIRQIAAVVGIVLLFGMYAVTFIAAMGRSETARSLFLGSLACTVLVPVFLYVLLLAAKVIGLTSLRSSTRSFLMSEVCSSIFRGAGIPT